MECVGVCFIGVCRLLGWLLRFTYNHCLSSLLVCSLPFSRILFTILFNCILIWAVACGMYRAYIHCISSLLFCSFALFASIPYYSIRFYPRVVYSMLSESSTFYYIIVDSIIFYYIISYSVSWRPMEAQKDPGRPIYTQRGSDSPTQSHQAS